MPDLPLPIIPEKFSLTPEFRLLAACSWIAPPALEQDQAERIASLCKAGIDWEEFLVLVRRHGVSSLAYTMLCRHAGDRLPAAIRDILKTDHIQSSGQALLQSAELIRIGKRFSEQGIEMIPLKGVLLSQRLYGSPAMRKTLDIDILVKVEDLERADAILKDDGYQCDQLDSGLTIKQKHYIKQYTHHFEYANEHRGIRLELHCRSHFWAGQQIDELWNNSHSLDFMGSRFNVLNDGVNLLYLCEHGARHNWICLKWLSDVAMLLADENLDDWENLIGQADRLDLSRVLAHSALMAHWIYGIILPESLCNVINREKKLTELGRSAMKVLLQGTVIRREPTGRRAERLEVARHLKLLKPSLSYGMILKELLITPEDFKLMPLPDKMFWMYYPLRPILWLWGKYMSPRK